MNFLKSTKTCSIFSETKKKSQNEKNKVRVSMNNLVKFYCYFHNFCCPPLSGKLRIVGKCGIEKCRGPSRRDVGQSTVSLAH